MLLSFQRPPNRATGVSAGAALGAMLALTLNLPSGVAGFSAVPIASFAGSLGAVAIVYALARAKHRGISTNVLLLAGVLFATVHLFFRVPAIFVSRAGPLAAIQRSVGLVRRHLWPSVALIILTWLILAGMSRVWDLLASNLQSPYGVVLVILGNAYVASGLIAAAMVFYLQRSEQSLSGTT